MTTPDGRFWELVNEEVRATWQGRWRWLWRGVALAVSLAAFIVPANGFGSELFFTLVALTSWIPAYLGSDLLSLEFPQNPEPQRHWPLRAYIARFVGRMVPFLAIELLWVGPFTFRSLLGDNPSKGGFLDFLAYHSHLQMLGHWTAWMLVFVVSGLPYALTAALLSGLFRRPRRLLVTLTTMTLAVSTASLLRLFVPPLLGSSGSLPAVSDLGFLTFCSSFSIGWSLVVALIQNAERLSWIPTPLLGSISSFPGWCGIASAAFLLYSSLASLWLSGIVRRRERRHPDSRASEVNGKSTAVVQVSTPGI